MRIRTDIMKAARTKLTFDRRSLCKASSQYTGHTLADRVFGALLNACVREGQIECIPCCAHSNKIYYTYVSSERLNEFDRVLDIIKDLTVTPQTISSIVERALGQVQGAHYSTGIHAAGHLVLRGDAVYVSAKSIRLTTACQAK